MTYHAMCMDVFSVGMKKLSRLKINTILIAVTDINLQRQILSGLTLKEFMRQLFY